MCGEVLLVVPRADAQAQATPYFGVFPALLLRGTHHSGKTIRNGCQSIEAYWMVARCHYLSGEGPVFGYQALLTIVQVWPKSFYSANGGTTGDLQGIIAIEKTEDRSLINSF